MKHQEGEPLPSINDLLLCNRDDCLMLPHRFTNTKKTYNASFAQDKSPFLFEQKIFWL